MTDIIATPWFSEPVNAISHLLGAAMFLVLAVFTLIRGRGNGPRVTALAVYAVCAVFMFSMSGVYHLLEQGSTASYVLRILDHAAIFTMIAGSFTPFHLIMLRGHARWVPLLVIWVLAITGLTFTAIYFQQMSEGLLLSFFLTMGWMGAYTYRKIKAISRQVAGLILTGALLYTLGAVLDYLRWPIVWEGIFGAHEAFHVFIMAAALCHWQAIHCIAHLPTRRELEVRVQEHEDGAFSACIAGVQQVFVGASPHEIKGHIQHWLMHSYPKAMVPQRLRYEFFKQEWVKLEP